jgi:uncharacterized protein YcbK (DUF882 family)
LHVLSRHRGVLAGTAAAAILAAAGLACRVAAQPGERAISIYNIHTKETVTTVFKRGTKYDSAALERISHVMRDHRRNESTRMDPELVDLLWEMHRELGSREPIHLVSGYRSRSTNDMLRRTSGGQASESRHILGKAADVHFPDVPVRKLRYAALVQERGGVGYYPTSALPFVHVDTDRVRSWPRLPRHELALLFPSGSTRHAPADGGPITKEDARLARVRHASLAEQVEEFHRARTGDDRTLAVAETRRGPSRIAALSHGISPAAPTLVELPQAVLPPRVSVSLSPSASDRARLAELANLASLPQLVVGPALARRPVRPQLASLTAAGLPAPSDALLATGRPLEARNRVAALDRAAIPGTTLDAGGRFDWAGWVPSPAYDDEHPEELSYRPFPITPYMTETPNQPLMHELVSHDVARSIDILDQPDTAPTLRFLPLPATASMLWAQQFTGAVLGIDRLRAAQAADAPPPARGLRSRPVRTSRR